MVAANDRTALQRDVAAMFTKPKLPKRFGFYDTLSPLHQRLFVVDLYRVLVRCEIEASDDAFRELEEVVESWEATAELDAAPEVLERIRKPKAYRPFEPGR